MDWLDKISVALTDADNFELEEPTEKVAAIDKWEGEDEDDDVKVRKRDKRRLEWTVVPLGKCYSEHQ